MSLIKRAAGRISDRSVIGPDDPWRIPTNGELGMTTAGVRVTEKSAMQLLAVYACVRLISGTLSNLRLDAIQTNRQGLETIVKKPPLIVSDPFGGQNVVNGITTKVGFGQMATSALLRGNAFAATLTFDRDGYPERVKILPPSVVDVDVDDSGHRLYQVNGKPFPTERMVHVMGLALPGDPVGLSVIDFARRSIGLGIVAEEFGIRFFANGANMSGIIKVTGELNPTKARELKENFESKNAGMSNSHAVGVLTGGAEFEKISITPDEAQFLQTRGMQTADIAMMYGVPPHMLGQVDRTTSWGKGIEEQTLGFVKFTLADWAQRFEDAWSAMMPANMTARFNFDTLLRPDTINRFTAYQMARNSTIFTPNEIRAREGYEPVEGGDDLFAPLNSAHTTEPDWTPGKPEEDPNAEPDGDESGKPNAGKADDNPKGKGK